MRTFECEEKDQNSSNNEERIETKFVQIFQLNSTSMCLSEIHYSMLYGIHYILMYLMYFVFLMFLTIPKVIQLQIMIRLLETLRIKFGHMC